MISVATKLFSDGKDSRPSILLLGNYRPALAVARGLRDAGYRIVMGKRGGEGFSEYSRFVDEAWDHPPVETDVVGLQVALTKFLSEREDIQFVLPISEPFVMFFAERMQTLPGGVTLVSPRADLVKTCADKVTMLYAAVEEDVPVLPCAVLVSDSDNVALGREVGLPIVARPLSPGAKFNEKKAVIIDSWSDYQQFVSDWCKPNFPILIQRQAVGPRVNVFFTAREGELINNLQTYIRRTDSLDGTGYAVDGVTVATSAPLLEDCEKLVRALDYTGIGLAQFIVDPKTGERCFLEINPRIAGSQAITEQMGFEMSRIAVDLALGLDPEPPKRVRGIRSGFRYAWVYGDIRGLHTALARGEIGVGGAMRWALKTSWTALWADHHMTWAWYDPVPTLMLFARQLFPSLERLSGTSVKEGQSSEADLPVMVGEGPPARGV
ncbi:MAG: hypothetical protein CMI60_12400 [Parvibaculum sp.]|jgi:predicted ATP-grasp superfamily ATP-dependent carboligase|nr:hypothetical protein [Parvibaculum sp.]|tara:strand:- start:4098 stop:5408 length:1311 start_codon:yes stop_codon:yes gene_type:complete